MDNGQNFLVVGTAIIETITHRPQGGSRRSIGGVAGTIALALKNSGEQVKLLTAIGEGPQGDECAELLNELGLADAVQRRRGAAGYTRINTINGKRGRAEGSWPRLHGLAKTASDIAPNYHCVITDCCMPPGQIKQTLDQPGKHNMVNGTTTRRAAQIMETRDTPKTLVTLNQAEARTLMMEARVRHESRLMNAIRTRNLLITRGSQGWTLYGENGEASSPAVTVPEYSDFIGCGNYAAAGAIRTLLRNLDPVETINQAISTKLAMNVVPPPPRLRGTNVMVPIMTAFGQATGLMPDPRELGR